MRSNYKKLGDFIEEVNVRNKNLSVERLLGVSIQKILIPSIANTVGTDMSRYKVVRKNQFAYGPVTSRNGEKISIALLEDYDSAIISQSYKVFKIIDEQELEPEYLMMWFRRLEFDRYARFMSHGSTRETFDWSELCETELPVPSIEKQREIVAEYNVVKNRIKLNEHLNQKLEETAQALYKHWFVDFEFPCLPSDYRPHGQVNLKISDEELRSKIVQVCTYKRTGGLPISDGRTWFVYLILCDDDSIYKGITNDLHRRFYEHYTAQGAKHTERHKPVKIIHWEQFDTKKEAAKREKDLKTGYGRTWISRQIEKAGGLSKIITGLPAPKTQLRSAGKMVYNEELDKEIPEGWGVKLLSSIVDLDSPISYGVVQPGVEDFFNGVKFIRSGDIENGQIQTGQLRTITTDVSRQFKRTILSGGEILVSIVGKPGQVARVPSSLKGANIARQVALIRISRPSIASFVKNYLNSGFGKDSLKNITQGSVQEVINLTDLRLLNILLPPDTAVLHFFKLESKIQLKMDLIFSENKILNELEAVLLSKMSTT